MAEPKKLNIIVAATQKNQGIGYKGDLPWGRRLFGDLIHFQKLTKTVSSIDKEEGRKNVVCMGLKTWESIPEKFRPLSERINVILSTTLNDKTLSANTYVCRSFQQFLHLVDHELAEQIAGIFIIGGARVYEEALATSRWQKIYYTLVEEPDFACDTFFPPFKHLPLRSTIISPTEETENIFFSIKVYEKIEPPSSSVSMLVVKKEEKEKEEEDLHKPNYSDYIYILTLQKILDQGMEREDRTGVGTISIFGEKMVFDLRDDSFPLLTTKKMFWRGIVEELLWFISGSTDANVLTRKGINIWKENGSKEFLTKLGFGYREEGDLGPVYGFQWRHFGAKYINKDTDYTGQGFDQLADVIHQIKTNPTSRRIVMSAWNPADLKEMTLPPCHMFCQFYVEGGELSCQMYQRSADFGLGVPFNIASYALLTKIIAHVCDLKPRKFIHVIGDAHIYKNHIDKLKEQILRTPFACPTLKIITENKDIDSFKFEDFVLENYHCHSRIDLPMAV
jgi:thymidylate synthase